MSSNWQKFRNIPTGNKTFLKNWHDKGEIVVFIHTKTGIERRRRHVIPYTTLDEKTNKPRMAYLNFTCFEDPYEYDKENPKICPVEMMVSVIRNDNSIADDTIVWEAAIGSPKDRMITKADLMGDGNWKNKMSSRAECVLALINVEAVAQGIQIATEPGLLADKINDFVDARIKSKGDELGDPDITPCAMRFEYCEREALAKDKYKVWEFERAQLTPEIKKLLDKGPQDVSRLLKLSNAKKLREIMESCLRVPVDLDLVFANVDMNKYGDGQDTDFNPEELEKEEGGTSSTSSRRSSPLDAEPPKTTVQQLGPKCDTCNGTGKTKKGKTCPDCEGKGYEPLPEDDNAAVQMIDCDTCNGTGKTKKGKTCPDCEGTGKVPAEESDDETELCARCNNEIPAGIEKCPFCGAEFLD